MPLMLRPSGLGSGIDKDRPDYTVIKAANIKAANIKAERGRVTGCRTAS